MRKQILMAMTILAFGLSVTACKKEEAQTQQPAQPGQPAPTTQAAPAAPEAPATAAAGAFSESAPSSIAGKTLEPGGKGNVEVLNKAMINKIGKFKGNQVELEGWAVDDKGKSLPETVIVQLAPVKGGTEYFATGTRINRPRPDVEKYLKEPAFKLSAFSVKADASSLPVGIYYVKIIQVQGGNAYVSGPYVRIQKTE